MTNDITIATNCYEMDYKLVMSTIFGGGILKCQDNFFARRMLLVSNVKSVEEVMHYYQQSDIKEIIDDLIICDQYSGEIFDTYNLQRESFYKKNPLLLRIKKSIKNQKIFPKYSDGYYYSIAPMCAINRCKTEWLLYLTEDSFLVDVDAHNWILFAMDLMKKMSISLLPIRCGIIIYGKLMKRAKNGREIF